MVGRLVRIWNMLIGRRRACEIDRLLGTLGLNARYLQYITYSQLHVLNIKCFLPLYIVKLCASMIA